MLNYVNFYIIVSFHVDFILMLCQRHKCFAFLRKESQRDSD